MKNNKFEKLIQFLEEKLSYTFLDNDSLITAFTHKSISKNNYERYEFLGDAVIRLSITRKIFQMYPDSPEGELSREVQKLISRDSLALLAQKNNLIQFLNYKDLNFKEGSSLTKSISANLTESLIGAIFLDSNFDQADNVVLNFYFYLLNKKRKIGQKDAKTLLQEYTQSLNMPLPRYSTKKLKGPAHSPCFLISCIIDTFTEEISTKSSTVQEGQQRVAKLLLRKIQNDK